MDATLQRSVDKFLGINNVANPTRLFPETVNREYIFPLQEANNVLIDDTFRIASRGGYTKIMSGNDIHSMWSNNKICLLVDGENLLFIDPVYQNSTVRSGLMLGQRMSYVNVNGRVYYTNGYQIGYILNGADNMLTPPGMEFKETIPAGQLIEVFLGCLYVAVGNTLYISDPLCDYYDTRYGYRIFKDKITLLRAINEDGIYVADSETWFLKGKGNDEYERDSIYPAAAIPFTDVVVPGSYVDDSITSDVAIWTSTNGIIMGDGSGKIMNLTQEKYVFEVFGKGTAFVRDMDNIRYYINSIY